MSEQIDVVIVGAGQAGLAVSHELTQAGVAHVVLERGRVGQTWRGWWESFCLMAPNWTNQLPGQHYDGEDPDGFMARDEVVAFLERYAAGFAAPVREGIDVTSIGRGSGGGFVLQTSAGQITARTVVLGDRCLPAPAPPGGRGDAARRPAADRRRAVPQPRGAACRRGARGRQRPVGLSDRRGSARGGPRRLSGVRARAVGAAPHRRARRHLVGRRDRVFRRAGQLAAASGAAAGRQRAVKRSPGRARPALPHAARRWASRCSATFLAATAVARVFAADLADSVAWGDQVNAQLMNSVRALAAERGLPAPQIDEPRPFREQAPEQLDLDGLRGRRLRQRVSPRL